MTILIMFRDHIQNTKYVWVTHSSINYPDIILNREQFTLKNLDVRTMLQKLEILILNKLNISEDS